MVTKKLNRHEEDGFESFWCFYALLKWGIENESFICGEVQFGALLCGDVIVEKLKRWRLLLPISTSYFDVWKLIAIEWV